MPPIQRILSCLFLCVCLAGPSLAFAASHSLETFATERVQPQQGNSIIIPWEGRFLATLGNGPLPENRLLLRRKFGKDEYGLFAGQLKEGGYARLKAFRIDSVGLQDLMKLKFYDSPARDWYLDLDEVYFEDGLVLVEGRSEIHCHSDGRWRKAEALAQPPSRLNLASRPPGAQVWIDGNHAGSTPTQVRGIGRPMVRIQMKLPGFYMVDEPVQIKPGQEQVFGVQLVAQADADTQSLRRFDSADIAGLRKANAPSQGAYVERQAKLARLQDSLRNELLSDLARFDRGYPPMKGRDEFEKSSEFEKRKSEYESERVAQRKLFSARREAQLEYLAETFRAIDSLLRPFEERRVRIAAPCPVKLGLYDADAEVQSLNVDCGGFGVRYLGTCNLSIPPETARRLRLHPDSLRLYLAGWNILSATADGQIANMAWDTLAFAAFDSPRLPSACTRSPVGNVTEAMFMEHGRRKAEFYHRESARRMAEERSRRDSLAAAEKRSAWERERRLAEESEEQARRAKAKRKRISRMVRLGAGSALLAGAAAFAWNGNSAHREAEAFSERYQNSLSVEAARQNKAAYIRHSGRARRDYLAGGLAFAVSLPLLFF